MTASDAVDDDVNPFAFSVNLSDAVRPLQESGVAIVSLKLFPPKGEIPTGADPSIPLSENRIDVSGAEEARVKSIAAVVPAFTEYCAAVKAKVKLAGLSTVTVTAFDTDVTGVPPVAASPITAAPPAAVVATLTIKLPVVCPLAIVNGAAVIPAGSVCGVTTTAPVNPAARVMATATVPEVPAFIAAAGAVAVKLNSGTAACTISVSEAVAL